MSLLDDAQRLAGYAEVRFDERGYPVCSGALGCGRVLGAPWTPAADFHGHAPECSAVAVPKIVAALEAAEQMLLEADALQCADSCLDESLNTLEAALRGGA